jgi:uncharacterized RDD family membrane protein YckC
MPASLWNRFVASFVDLVVMVVVAAVVAVVLGDTSSGTNAQGVHSTGFHLGGGGLLIVGAVYLAYTTACEATTGATLGKKLEGIRVVRVDGSRAGWGRAFARNVLRCVDGLFFYLVGVVFIASSPRKQRVGDRVAGTMVVRLAPAAAPGTAFPLSTQQVD